MDRRPAAALAIAAPGLADEVVIAVATEPTSLDPLFQALGSNHELAKHAFNSIVEPGAKYELEPGLAQSWGPTDDPLVWEFKLRKGVKFHNGEPFTAHDAAFTYERAPNVPNAPSTYKRRTAKIAESVMVDDHTLRVRTKTPYPLLPNSLASVPIVSRTVGMDAEPTEFNDGSKLYGTGPYKFVEFVAGDHVTHVANEDYWGGKPKWDKVTIRWIKSGPARVAALLSGDVRRHRLGTHHRRRQARCRPEHQRLLRSVDARDLTGRSMSIASRRSTLPARTVVRFRIPSPTGGCARRSTWHSTAT